MIMIIEFLDRRSLTSLDLKGLVVRCPPPELETWVFQVQAYQ